MPTSRRPWSSAAILTVLIVFCFLNSWRSTVITGLTLPISVISSFIVMYFLGMTLNMMTLMALSLAIGLLIDDAIVVRENIVRHLERGEDHFTAAREGTTEIGLAVLATSMSIIAVFVPVAFMKGIIGRFFFQFGITVAFAVLVSLFVSFTLDPMLSSRWYDPDIERKGRRNLLQRAARPLQRLVRPHRRRLQDASSAGRSTTARRWSAGAAGAFVAGLGVFALLQTEFMTADGPGRVRHPLQERARRLDRRDARPARGGARGARRSSRRSATPTPRSAPATPTPCATRWST